MNPRSSAMPKVLFRLIIIAVLFILCLGLASGCQQTNTSSSGEKTAKRISEEKVLYVKNGVVYETNLSGTKNRKIFSSRQSDQWGIFEYFPEKRAFIYTTLDQKQQVLREYSLSTMKDEKIDSIEFLKASDEKTGVLYTKSEGVGVENAFMPPNKLFLYTPGKGSKYLNIQNIRSTQVSRETAELCYTSFTPIKQTTETPIKKMTEPPSKMYVTKLDNIKPQLVASFPEGIWAALVSFSKEHIIYNQGKPNAGVEDSSLYLFDRRTKQTRLIKDRVLSMGIDKKRKALLVAKTGSKGLKDLSFWEIQYENDTKTKLFDLTLSDVAGPFIARYSPDGKYIVLNGWASNLGIYDFTDKRYKTLFAAKDESVGDFIFTPDGGYILCTVGKPLYDSSISKDVIYKVELKSGKYTPLTKPSKSDDNEIIKLIGVYR